MAKKEGNTLLTKDLEEVIYGSNINPEQYFVEKLHSSFFSTVLCVVHK